MLKDGRKSFTQIANECGETKATICKHFNEMEKAGIITGATIQLNYASFGYNTVGSITFKINPQNADYAVDYLRKILDIYGGWKSNNSRIFVVATLKTVDELNKVKEAIKRLPTVSELTTNIWMGIRNTPENLQIITSETITEKADYLLNKSSSNNSINIDQMDSQIIEKLAKEGRMPFDKIAKELDISTNTVIRRYERLHQNGIINVSIQVNPLKLGYRGMAIFNLAFLTQSSLSSIVDKLGKIPDVTLIIKTSGIYDLSICLMVKDIDQLITFRDEIANIVEIARIEMILEKAHSSLPLNKEYISTF